jgi:YHYH protein/Secretion system C-terminal sorting domain
MKNLIIMLFLMPFVVQSQTIISKWTMNANGKKASYWAQTGTAQTPTYTFTNTTDSADILSVCYTTDYAWVRSQGMTDNMGRYANPGNCSAQNYIHKFPRNPTVAATKTVSPKGGAIGLLLNGIPIFGLGNASSWNGSANVMGPAGSGIWNVEVGKSEGFVLDTAFGAHPQQQGAYHSHTTPFRLYKYTASTSHSPLIGFAFDGNPIYGPYGYSTATNSSSAVARMKSGYSQRNITTRTTLPYGVAASQTGPAVSATYPIGTYCEDYEWLASNGGDLDKYNGRTCVTPDYPSGTYAYFVTVDALGVAAFPYYVGIEYYGTPETSNFSTTGTGNTVTSPTGATCKYANRTGVSDLDLGMGAFSVYPNPSRGGIRVRNMEQVFTDLEVYDAVGRLVRAERLQPITNNEVGFDLNVGSGIYFVRCRNGVTGFFGVQKLVVE